MNRKIKLFVIGSVLLNLLLAGAVLGQLAHGGMKGPPGPPEIAGLSAEKQALVRKTMDKAAESGKSLRDQVNKAREETMRIFASEPFDDAAYQAQVDKMMGLHRERRQRMADAFKQLAKQLTPEERALVAKAFRQPPGYWGPGGPQGGPPPGDTPGGAMPPPDGCATQGAAPSQSSSDADQVMPSPEGTIEQPNPPPLPGTTMPTNEPGNAPNLGTPGGHEK